MKGWFKTMEVPIRFMVPRFEHRLLEWYLGFSMFLGGIYLILARTIFELAPYALIRQIASEPLWGQVLLICGGLRLVCLTFNGILPHGTPHLRVILALVSIVVWSQLAIGYLASRVPTLMIAFTIPAVFFEIVIAYRAAKDASVEDVSPGKSHGTD